MCLNYKSTFNYFLEGVLICHWGSVMPMRVDGALHNRGSIRPQPELRWGTHVLGGIHDGLGTWMPDMGAV